MEGEKKGACCSLQPCLVIFPSVSDREKEVNAAGSRTFSSFFSHREEPLKPQTLCTMQQLRVSWLHDRENSIMGIGFRQQPTANENPQRGGPSMSHYEAPFYSLSLSLLFLAHIVQCVVVCQESQAANGALSTNSSRSTRPFSLPSYPHAPTHNTSDQSPTDPDSLNRPNSQIMKKGEETGAGKQWRKIHFCCRWSLFDKYKFTKKKKKKRE